jgi:hypothetical protein
MTGMTEQSHFVPQGYLKGWSADGKRVWMDRLLVSTDSLECDQNLWDAVGISLGRTQGVESHRTLGDYR